MNALTLGLLLASIAVVVAALSLRYRLGHTADRGDLEAALDAEVKKFTDRGLSYGLVLGVYKDGNSWVNGYGSTSREGGVRPDAHTVFELASVSKLLTAATLQLLCDEGVLGLDDTLGQLIGEHVVLSPAARATTLRQLVTHTSGFPPLPKAFVKKMTDPHNPYSSLELSDLLAYLQTTEGKRKPGRFAYSNFGMGLLGHVLERVTGQPFEALVADHLLRPLGMNHTAVAMTPGMQAALAQGYAEDGTPNPLWVDRVLTAAGSFKSDASDMLKFIQANLAGTSPLALSLKKMHAQQPSGDTGMGWMQPTFLDRFVGNRSVVWHNGRVGGYASYLAIDPVSRTGVVVLSNKSVDITMLGMMMMRQVRTQSWTRPPVLMSPTQVVLE